jgi:hypothetical protein
MTRKLFLLATLTASVGLFAQGAAPAAPGNTVVMPGTNIYVVGGGLYGTGVYVVPGGAAVGPGTAGGISLAGRAGISVNQPLQLGVQSTLAPSWPVNAGTYVTGYATAPEAASPENVSPAPGGAANDFGPSYAGGGEPQASGTSLGEIAAYYKANQPQNVRTYTNADAQRAANTVTIHGTSGGANPKPASPQAVPPPMAESQPQAPASSGNQTIAANVKPPEVAQAQPPANAAPGATEGKTRLPATSTLLPLLGLVGLISGGIGLWLRSRLP